MKVPKVSVIMPVYNSGTYLNEAIDSILNQKFEDFEFVIIDDGSTDQSQEIVKSYSDPRIRFYVNEKNMGVAATLNRGLKLAVGEYIARMDSDDISLPDRFDKQVSYMDTHPKVAVCATGIRMFGAQNGEKYFSTTHDQLKVDLLFNNCLAHPTVMMRRSVVGCTYRYNEEFSAMEDYALWIEVSRKYELASIKDVLLMYRIHQSQVTQNPPKNYLEQEKMLKNTLLLELGVLNKKNLEIFTIERSKCSPEEKVDYIILLNAMVKANQTKQIYNQKCLEKTVRSIINILLHTFSIREATNLARSSGINGITYVTNRIVRGLVCRAFEGARRAKLRVQSRS